MKQEDIWWLLLDCARALNGDRLRKHFEKGKSKQKIQKSKSFVFPRNYKHFLFVSLIESLKCTVGYLCTYEREKLFLFRFVRIGEEEEENGKLVENQIKRDHMLSKICLAEFYS